MSADADKKDKITVGNYLNLLRKADASYTQAMTDLSDRAYGYKVRCLQAENELVEIIAALMPEIQPSLIREIARVEPKNALVDTVQSLTRQIKSGAQDRRLLYKVMRQETKGNVRDYAAHVDDLNNKMVRSQKNYRSKKTSFKESGADICRIVKFNMAHQAKPITSESLEKAYAPTGRVVEFLRKISGLYKNYFTARKLIDAVKQPEGLGDQIANCTTLRTKTKRALKGYRHFRHAARLAGRRLATYETYTTDMKNLHAERKTAVRSNMAYKAVAGYLLADPTRLAGLAQAWPEKQYNRAMQFLGRHAVYSKVQAKLIEETLNLKNRQAGLQSEIASKKTMPSGGTLRVNQKKLDRTLSYPKHRASSVVRQIGTVQSEVNKKPFVRSLPKTPTGSASDDSNNFMMALVAYDVLLGGNQSSQADQAVEAGQTAIVSDTVSSFDSIVTPDPADAVWDNPVVPDCANPEACGAPPAVDVTTPPCEVPSCPDCSSISCDSSSLTM